jgi:hypothetical protein
MNENYTELYQINKDYWYLKLVYSYPQLQLWDEIFQSMVKEEKLIRFERWNDFRRRKEIAIREYIQMKKLCM